MWPFLGKAFRIASRVGADAAEPDNLKDLEEATSAAA
jgi:hypothetical protein